jgi:hypothetical protein
MRTCGTSCHKNSFIHKIYMTFCATTLNIVTVACSFHVPSICTAHEVMEIALKFACGYLLVTLLFANLNFCHHSY